MTQATLIIGGNGFVGSHVSDMLLRQGATVRVLDRYPERFRAPNQAIAHLVGDFMGQELFSADLKHLT